MTTFAEIEIGGLFGFWEQGQFCTFRKKDTSVAEFLQTKRGDETKTFGVILTDFDPEYQVFELSEKQPVEICQCAT